MVASWCLPDEQSLAAEKMMNQIRDGIECSAPSIWAYEVRQTLLKAWRRRRIDSSQMSARLILLESIPVRLMEPPSFSDLFQAAYRYGLSVYDAAYLDLAARESLPLASLDRALCDAAGRAGVTLFRT